jgi:hypothetical protein
MMHVCVGRENVLIISICVCFAWNRGIHVFENFHIMQHLNDAFKQPELLNLLYLNSLPTFYEYEIHSSIFETKLHASAKLQEFDSYYF